MLTDCIYWLIIYPFLTIKDYNLSFVSTTTLNTSSTSLCSIIFLALGKNRCVPESCGVRNIVILSVRPHHIMPKGPKEWF